MTLDTLFTTYTGIGDQHNLPDQSDVQTSSTWTDSQSQPDSLLIKHLAPPPPPPLPSFLRTNPVALLKGCESIGPFRLRSTSPSIFNEAV